MGRYLADERPGGDRTLSHRYLQRLPKAPGFEQADTGPGGIYARLEESGHVLARFTEEVGARMPSPEERRALEIGASVPVLTVLRTAYDTNDVAVEVCDTVKVATATCWNTSSAR